MLVHVRLEELMVAPPMGLGLEQRNVRRATFASAASARTRKPSKSLDLEADATTEVSNIFPSYDEITTGFAELGGDDITQLELRFPLPARPHVRTTARSRAIASACARGSDRKNTVSAVKAGSVESRGARDSRESSIPPRPQLRGLEVRRYPSAQAKRVPAHAAPAAPRHWTNSSATDRWRRSLL